MLFFAFSFRSPFLPVVSSSVYLSASNDLTIGGYTSASLIFSLSTTFSFKDLPCRIMIGLIDGSAQFFVDSAFTLSPDNKSASLSVPLGNIREKLGEPGPDSAKCRVAILIPCLGLNSATTVVTAGDLTVYSDSELSEVTYDSYPFQTEAGSTESYPKLLAYRFRAYESVYNAYYRDIRNNPFVVNGRPVYNKWLPTMKGGADSTSYELNQCNWERDFLTTAVPNPQQTECLEHRRT